MRPCGQNCAKQLNAFGGAGQSDHLKEMLARKNKKINKLKIVEKKSGLGLTNPS